MIRPKLQLSLYTTSQTSLKSAIVREDLTKVKEIYTHQEFHMHKRVRACFQAVINEEVATTADLNLKFTPLDGDGAQHVSLILPFYESLLSLRLWKTHLGTPGCACLAKALQALPQLQLLSLEDNLIDAPGIRALSQGLKSLIDLQELYLHDNRLKPEGGLILSTLLPHFPKLRTLTVDENGLEDASTIEILHSICKTELPIKLLGLGYNKLTETTANELFRSLGLVTTLKKITFGGTKMGANAKMELQSAFGEVRFEF